MNLWLATANQETGTTAVEIYLSELYKWGLEVKSCIGWCSDNAYRVGRDGGFSYR